jgi:hypothetical protein
MHKALPYRKEAASEGKHIICYSILVESLCYKPEGRGFDSR